MEYEVEKKSVDDSMSFWLGISTWFSKSECKELWGEHADHYWDKYWAENGNGPFFYNRLDPTNQRKLVNWYNNKMIDK